MSFTAKQVIDTARQTCNDKDATTWGDPEFLIVVNDCVSLIHNNYPESRLDTDGALIALSEVTDINDDVPLSDVYRPAVVAYLEYRFFDSDAGDTRDAKQRDKHLERFLTLIGEKE
ncbi:MAG: hypothetical protein M0R74_03070 [Dehalococcoidia bacterium]|jgi:hypothetical protein|nr:hypothetical protein [Dehalococcoidia bacterium]